MKHIYFLNENNTGALYGVGTYMNNLLQVLPADTFKVTIIYLYTNFSEITVRVKGAVRSIYIPEPASRSKPALYNRNIFYLLAPYIEKGENNILHLNFRSCLELVSLLRKHFCFRVVLTWHFFSGIDFTSGKVFENILQGDLENNSVSFNDKFREIIREEFFLLNNLCDKIILVARHSLPRIRKIYKVPPEKLEVIHNCLPDGKLADSKLTLRQKFNFPREEKIIVFAGRLDINKNASVLINSFHKVRLKYPESRLVIAGEGDFRALLSLLGPDYAYITFTGFLNKEKLYQLYTLADIGVIPSHYEEFGYVAVEMMMHGLPVIANRTSGLAEIVEDGVTGELVDLYAGNKEEEAVERLATALVALLDHPEKIKILAENGRASYLKNFGIDLFKEKMLEVYEKIEENPEKQK